MAPGPAFAYFSCISRRLFFIRSLFLFEINSAPQKFAAIFPIRNMAFYIPAGFSIKKTMPKSTAFKAIVSYPWPSASGGSVSFPLFLPRII